MLSNKHRETSKSKIFTNILHTFASRRTDQRTVHNRNVLLRLFANSCDQCGPYIRNQQPFTSGRARLSFFINCLRERGPFNARIQVEQRNSDKTLFYRYVQWDELNRKLVSIIPIRSSRYKVFYPRNFSPICKFSHLYLVLDTYVDTYVYQMFSWIDLVPKK